MVGWFRCFSDPNSVVTEEDSTFLFSTVKPCETNGLGVRPADWRATFPEDVVYWDMVWVLCLGRMSQTYQALMAPFTQFRAWSTWRVIGAPGKCGGQFESC